MEQIYHHYHTTQAHGRLAKLAENPPDLTDPRVLTAQRLARYRTPAAAGIELLYGCQRVDDAILDGLQQLADERRLIDQFEMMRRGVVMNRIVGYDSENRAVLHTACRDLFTDTPYHPEATAAAKTELTKLDVFLTALDEGTIRNADGEPFTTLVCIGIGGSDLGPRALALALAPFHRPNRRLAFIANVDPDDAAGILAEVDLAHSLVCVVSKSGTTLETRTNEELARAALTRCGLDPNRHCIAVTGAGSPMDDTGRYRAVFHMFDYIGGRYSATSMVGGLPLAFALGMDGFREILRGANDMDQAAMTPDCRANPALLLALLGVWNRNYLKMATLAVLPYAQALARFPAHLQQCDMESNGKSVDRLGRPVDFDTGPIVWGEPGTNGQHAFYQLLHQGTTVVPAEFLVFRQSQRGHDLEVDGTTSQEKLVANCLAQALALAAGRDHDNPNRRFPGNRPSAILVADRLTPYTMGALLALYEAKIAFQGFLWNINSFDQEGVQLGKILAGKLLDHLAARRRDATYDGGASDPLGWALLQAVYPGEGR